MSMKKKSYMNSQNILSEGFLTKLLKKFGVGRSETEKIKNDPRFCFGLPSSDNANYLWIQMFYSALKKDGRAGFVMANSASDISGSEMEIRKKLIKLKIVDIIIAVGTNFFYTVTLPCSLWFFDKKKKNINNDKILFIIYLKK